jgi:hypothetical protein
MIPPIVPIRSLRDLLTEHGWGHLAAPIKPAPIFDVTDKTKVETSASEVHFTFSLGVTNFRHIWKRDWT